MTSQYWSLDVCAWVNYQAEPAEQTPVATVEAGPGEAPEPVAD